MKCDGPAWMTWVVLVIGVIFLLKDLGMADWWNFSWWSVVFVLMGLSCCSGKK